MHILFGSKLWDSPLWRFNRSTAPVERSPRANVRNEAPRSFHCGFPPASRGRVLTFNPKSVHVTRLHSWKVDQVVVCYWKNMRHHSSVIFLLPIVFLEMVQLLCWPCVENLESRRKMESAASAWETFESVTNAQSCFVQKKETRKGKKEDERIIWHPITKVANRAGKSSEMLAIRLHRGKFGLAQRAAAGIPG